MNKEQRGSTPRFRIRRLVIAGAALGAVSAPALALTSAGAAPSPLVISTMSTSSGTVLSAGGKALYTIQTAGKPCTAKNGCFGIWPPAFLTSGQRVSAKGGVQASQLGTKVVNGKRQVTYKGKLVYSFSVDKAGQVTGNISDTWGKWAAVVVTPAASNSNSNTGSGSGSGGSNTGTGGASF